MKAFDALDREIIGALLEDGRMSVSTLARRVSLSPSATSERVKKLEASGVISGYSAIVSADAAHRPIQAIIEVQLDPSSASFDIDDELIAMPDVIDAFHLTGRFDYQLRIATNNIEGIEAAVRYLKEDLGVRETSTRVLLRIVDTMPRQPVPR